MRVRPPGSSFLLIFWSFSKVKLLFFLIIYRRDESCFTHIEFHQGVTILHRYEASPLWCVFVRSVLVKRMSCENDACTPPAKKSKVEQDRKGL